MTHATICFWKRFQLFRACWLKFFRLIWQCSWNVWAVHVPLTRVQKQHFFCFLSLKSWKSCRVCSTKTSLVFFYILLINNALQELEILSEGDRSRDDKMRKVWECSGIRIQGYRWQLKIVYRSSVSHEGMSAVCYKWGRFSSQMGTFSAHIASNFKGR